MKAAGLFLFPICAKTARMKKALLLCLAMNWFNMPIWAIGTAGDAAADPAPSKNPLTAMPLSHPSDWGDTTMKELGLSIGSPGGLNLGFGVRNIAGSGFYAKAYLGTLLVLWGGELEAGYGFDQSGDFKQFVGVSAGMGQVITLSFFDESNDDSDTLYGASIKYGFVAFDLITVSVGGAYVDRHQVLNSVRKSEEIFLPVVNIGLSWFF